MGFVRYMRGMVSGLGFKVLGLRLGFRAEGLEFGVEGLGLRVWG